MKALFSPLFRHRWLIPVLIILAAATIRFLSLGSYVLIDTTEGRYATIAQQMAQTGDWITPRLQEGEPFWGKPPLSFWLSAISFKVFGPGEFAARFPSFLLAIFGCTLTFLLARRLGGGQLALLAVAILSTSALFFILAGGVLTDPSLAATVTLSLVAFPLCMLSRNPVHSHAWGYVVFIGLGLSMLAKGPIGVVLTLFPIVGWTLWNHRLPDVLRRLPMMGGTLIFLAIFVPWHILAEIQEPGFLNYYLVGEHWKRFLEPGWAGDRYGNPHEYFHGAVWFFAIFAALPWSLILIAGSLWLLRKGVRPTNPWVFYIVLWLLAPVLVFTPTRNVIITYLLPSLPACALLTAMVIHRVRSLARLPARRNARVLSSSAAPWWTSRKTVFGSMAIVPAASLLAFLFFIPAAASNRSQQAVVMAFANLDRDSDADLIYFGKQPYSAAFYSSGRAATIDDDHQALYRTLRDYDQDYFAIHRRHLPLFKKAAGGEVEYLGQFGKYTLAREPDADDL